MCLQRLMSSKREVEAEKATEMHDSLCGQSVSGTEPNCSKEAAASGSLRPLQICTGAESSPVAEAKRQQRVQKELLGGWWMGGQTADLDKQVAVEWTQQGRNEAKLKLQRELGVLSSSVPDTQFVCVCTCAYSKVCI